MAVCSTPVLTRYATENFTFLAVLCIYIPAHHPATLQAILPYLTYTAMLNQTMHNTVTREKLIELTPVINQSYVTYIHKYMYMSEMNRKCVVNSSQNYQLKSNHKIKTYVYFN